MPNADVIAGKAGIVTRCLDRIAQVTSGAASTMTAVDVEDIIVLNLQRAIQACIDIMTHVCAEENLGTPASAGDGFAALAGAGYMDKELAVELKKMVGFRNLSVHEYDEIDSELLRAIVDKHLDDLRHFVSIMIQRFA